jgi:2-iminobutanoate/2-iminopropanoate deaminase
VFVSGQVGEGADFAAHVESAFAALVHRLEQAGATTSDVVKIRIFVKDLNPDLYGTVADVRLRTFPEGSWPASTVAGVQSLARDRFRVEVEAIAVVAETGVDLEIERLAPSNGFSGTVAVSAHGATTIYVSGQVGEGDGLGAQSASVWQRLGQRLEAAGASYSDLVKTTVYIVDFDPDAEINVYLASYPEALSGPENKPASTLLGVPALAADRFKIEIDAIAVIGAGETVERKFIDPERSYTQAVTAQGSGAKTIYLAGQIGRPGDSLADQADQVFANLAQRLAAAGASPSDLLKITIYIPGFSEADLAALGLAREKHGFLNDTAPASTLLGIQSLYSTEAAIEVEGIAVTQQ